MQATLLIATLGITGYEYMKFLFIAILLFVSCNILAEVQLNIERAAPIYPEEAQEKNIEGQVKFIMSVNNLGDVSSVQIIESEPKDLFDAAVIEAVKKYKFKPACEGDEIQPFEKTQIIQFRLKKITGEPSTDMGIEPQKNDPNTDFEVTATDEGVRIGRRKVDFGCKRSSFL